MRYTFRFYTPDEGSYTVECSAVGDTAAALVGEIRDEQSDMPVCFVHNSVLGNRIASALNAADDLFTRNDAVSHGR